MTTRVKIPAGGKITIDHIIQTMAKL